MVYSKRVNTLKASAGVTYQDTQLFVTKGLVHRILIDFPSGSAGLLGVAIFDGRYQVWPSTIGEWFVGDGVQVAFDDMYLKEKAPYIFDIYTCNADITYNHAVHISVGLVSNDVFMARFMPSVGYELYQKTLMQLAQEQAIAADKQKQAIIDNPFPWLKPE